MSETWNPSERAETFARELTGELGSEPDGGVRSVVLHGSVARGEAVEGLSDVNLLVLLGDVSPARLAAAAPLVRAWWEDTGAVPLVFTPGEWARSTDVYPVEVADMLDAHRLVAGVDPLEGMAVSLRHMRLQTERELRGKLIHLREGVLLAADRPDDLGRLLVSAAPSLATYLRTVIRLQRREAPPNTPDAAKSAARIVGGDPGAFLETWEARLAPDDFRPDLATVGRVTALMEAAAHFVDTMEDR